MSDSGRYTYQELHNKYIQSERAIGRQPTVFHGKNLYELMDELTVLSQSRRSPGDIGRVLIGLGDKKIGGNKIDRSKNSIEEIINTLPAINYCKNDLDIKTRRQYDDKIRIICNNAYIHAKQAVKGLGYYFGSQYRQEGEELLKNDLAEIKKINDEIKQHISKQFIDDSQNIDNYSPRCSLQDSSAVVNLEEIREEPVQSRCNSADNSRDMKVERLTVLLTDTIALYNKIKKD